MLITNILGREILDSRGNPTLEVEVYLQGNIYGRAAVPSGASKGSREAIELRDNDLSRFNGTGLLNNIKIIDEVIKPNLIGLKADNQTKIDELLINLDSTQNKSALGANTLLAVSLATAKAAANCANLSLFRYIKPAAHYTLPMPLINIINGGEHADNKLDLQEFMIAPIYATSFINSMQIAHKIFYALKSILRDKGYNTNYGDEGGFAPNLNTSAQALELIMQAIEKAGFLPGKDILIALDAAASEFYHNGIYQLNGYKKELSSSELIEYYEKLINTFPIFSIEDPIAENDINGWKNITKKLGNKIQIVGDDLFVTNPLIFQEGIKHNLANAILIKPNQIGTLSETLNTINLAHDNQYNTIISHRSGETEDTTISHLAVATNAKQIKTGSMTRSERLAKYNELIRINEEIGLDALYSGIYFQSF
jgi:enolase